MVSNTRDLQVHVVQLQKYGIQDKAERVISLGVCHSKVYTSHVIYDTIIMFAIPFEA